MMKRVVSYLLLTAMVFGFMAFSCSSKEITTAKLYIQQKRYDKALGALQEELKKNPNSDEGYKLLGDVYGFKGDYQKMVEAYDKSLSLSKRFEKEIKLAKTAKWADNFNKGAAYYNRATKQSVPDSSKKFYQKAVDAFNNAIICQPDSAKSYEYKAYAYFNMGAPEKAIEPLKMVLKKAPTKEIYVRLGEIILQQGQDKMNKFYETNAKEDSVQAINYYREAVKVLEEGKAKYPNDPNILNDLAAAYVSAKMLDTAMDAFKEGVEKDPNNKNYHYNYGVLLLGAKKYEEAIKQFEEALRIDPNYTNALYNIGVAYIKWGTAERDKAINEGREDDLSYQEKFKAALPYMEKYLEVNPKDAAIWDALGKIYANLGDTEKSKDAFEKADQYR
jgi:tetratricopeptide (TPR) repeat protein